MSRCGALGRAAVSGSASAWRRVLINGVDGDLPGASSSVHVLGVGNNTRGVSLGCNTKSLQSTRSGISGVLFAYQIACGRVEVGSIAYGWEVRCDDDLEARPPETEPEWRFSRIIAP